MTGKAGVAIATSGPGISNLVTGLATANTEGDPVIALGGAVALSDRLKKIHQTMDSVSLCKPVTKYSVEVDSPDVALYLKRRQRRSAVHNSETSYKKTVLHEEIEYCPQVLGVEVTGRSGR
jgi:acetolactate synthase I/II/III large subunit